MLPQTVIVVTSVWSIEETANEFVTVCWARKMTHFCKTPRNAMSKTFTDGRGMIKHDVSDIWVTQAIVLVSDWYQSANPVKQWWHLLTCVSRVFWEINSSYSHTFRYKTVILFHTGFISALCYLMLPLILPRSHSAGNLLFVWVPR